jgi:hypothetical protein
VFDSRWRQISAIHTRGSRAEVAAERSTVEGTVRIDTLPSQNQPFFSTISHFAEHIISRTLQETRCRVCTMFAGIATDSHFCPILLMAWCRHGGTEVAAVEVWGELLISSVSFSFFLPIISSKRRKPQNAVPASSPLRSHTQSDPSAGTQPHPETPRNHLPSTAVTTKSREPRRERPNKRQ